jgi:hypothetical protein
MRWNLRLLHCVLAGINTGLAYFPISNRTLGLHFQGSEKEFGFLAFTSDGLGWLAGAIAFHILENWPGILVGWHAAIMNIHLWYCFVL